MSYNFPYFLFNWEYLGEQRGFLSDRRVYRADLDKLVDGCLAVPAGSDIHQHRRQLLNAQLAEQDQRDKFADQCSDWLVDLLIARNAELRARRDLWLSQ